MDTAPSASIIAVPFVPGGNGREGNESEMGNLVGSKCPTDVHEDRTDKKRRPILNSQVLEVRIIEVQSTIQPLNVGL
jgi:hypothetical protein